MMRRASIHNRAVPVRPTAHVLLGVLMGVLQTTAATCAVPPTDDVADFLTTLLFDGLAPDRTP